MFEALDIWKGPDLVYNDNVGMFVDNKRDIELVWDANEKILTELLDDWHNLGNTSHKQTEYWHQIRGKKDWRRLV